MAAKRVSTSAVNWVAFAEKVPKSELPNFQALKAKNDVYVRRVAAYPDSLPKIDWNYYKSKISVPGMVDNFQKSYESLKVPYPSDNGLIAQIDEQEKEFKKNVSNYVATANAKVNELKKELTALEAELPYTEMTVEEFFLAKPELALDPVNFPTFWPHNEECFEFTRKLKESGKL